MPSLKLNVGCHDIYMDGFVNIDLDPAVRPDLVADALKLEDYFQPGSVDYIYCGHLLEHLSVPDGIFLVKSFFRLLRDYGSVVCVVPDFTKCRDLSIEEQDRIVLGSGEHKVLMTAARMRYYMTEAGFLTVLEAADLHNLNHCPFQGVKWQSGMLGLKHSQVCFVTR